MPKNNKKIQALESWSDLLRLVERTPQILHFLDYEMASIVMHLIPSNIKYDDADRFYRIRDSGMSPNHILQFIAENAKQISTDLGDDIYPFITKLLDDGASLEVIGRTTKAARALISAAIKYELESNPSEYHRIWCNRYVNLLSANKSPISIISASCRLISSFTYETKLKLLQTFVDQVSKRLGDKLVIESVLAICNVLKIEELPVRFFHKKPDEFVREMSIYLPKNLKNEECAIVDAIRGGDAKLANSMIVQGYRLSTEKMAEAILTPANKRSEELDYAIKVTEPKDLFGDGDPSIFGRLMTANLFLKDKLSVITAAYLNYEFSSHSVIETCGIKRENLHNIFKKLMRLKGEKEGLIIGSAKKIVLSDNLHIQIRIDIMRNSFGDGSLNLFDTALTYISGIKMGETTRAKHYQELFHYANLDVVANSEVLLRFVSDLPVPFVKNKSHAANLLAQLSGLRGELLTNSEGKTSLEILREHTDDANRLRAHYENLRSHISGADCTRLDEIYSMIAPVGIVLKRTALMPLIDESGSEVLHQRDVGSVEELFCATSFQSLLSRRTSSYQKVLRRCYDSYEMPPESQADSCGIQRDKVLSVLNMLISLYPDKDGLVIDRVRAIFESRKIIMDVKIDIARRVFGDGSLNLLDTAIKCLNDSDIPPKRLKQQYGVVFGCATDDGLATSKLLDGFVSNLPLPFNKRPQDAAQLLCYLSRRTKLLLTNQYGQTSLDILAAVPLQSVDRLQGHFEKLKRCVNEFCENDLQSLHRRVFEQKDNYIFTGL